MSCGVIIAAAGQGKRMGISKNKLFIELSSKPVLVHTLERFQKISWINEIVIVVHPDEIGLVEHLLQEYNINIKALVPGGKERQDSVENGLSHIESDWVMVHDGARPFISIKKLEELYNQVQVKEAVVLGVPVKDTIKILDDSGIVISTPERKSLWAIQTPQAFRVPILNDAYRKAKVSGLIATDESSLVEKLGIKVHVIEGDYRNIKITTPDDIIIAQRILDNWSEQ